MRTARMTVLMEPAEKAGIEARAAKLGLSGGEFIRLAAERLDEREVESELALLSSELEAAIPEMRASLDRSVASVRAATQSIDDCLRAVGVQG